MKIKIRPATFEDVEAILTIVNHSIRYSTANYDYEPRTLAQQEAWFLEKQHANWPILVAEFEEKIVGYGLYGTFRVKIGYRFTVEHSVYVSEEYIGKGIGQMLLSELIVLAKQQGFHVMIGCIDADNIGSIKFHEKLGFEITAHLKEVGFKYGRWLDLVMMQLRLE